MDLHSTDLRTFQGCRLNWWFSSPHGLSMRPNVISAPVFIGTLFHAAVEAWHKTFFVKISVDDSMAAGLVAIEQRAEEIFEDPHFKRSIVTLPERVSEDLAKGVEMAHGLFDAFCLWAPGRWEIIEVERPFRVNIRTKKNNPSRGWLAGKTDAIVRYRDKLWVADFKTSTPAAKGEAPEYIIDVQTNSYVWALRRLGYDIAGALRIMCYKVLPKEPELVKNGTRLSRRKITTTHEHVMKAIERHGLNPNDYADWLDDLMVAPHPTFQILEYPKTKGESSLFEYRLYTLYREVARNEIYPNEGRLCRYCWFKEPCVAMNQGLPVSWILEEYFNRREIPDANTE